LGSRAAPNVPRALLFETVNHDAEHVRARARGRALTKLRNGR
jgi:hypothetical protein